MQYHHASRNREEQRDIDLARVDHVMWHNRASMFCVKKYMLAWSARVEWHDRDTFISVLV